MKVSWERERDGGWFKGVGKMRWMNGRGRNKLNVWKWRLEVFDIG